MAQGKSYSQKLLDPKWQKLRLQVMNRDQFKCAHCNDSESTLHVHHKYYIYGNEPWEYEMLDLVTLCEQCHNAEEECKRDVATITRMLLREGKTYFDIASHIYSLKS